jgi:signal transduction histidine kinase
MDNPSSPLPENVQTELDRQIFHLQTLYDVSRELLGVVEIEAVLKRFLLMTLGNFGVIEGFILTHDTHSNDEPRLVAIGIQDKARLPLVEGAVRFLSSEPHGNTLLTEKMIPQLGFLPPEMAYIFVFTVDERCCGIIGLGSKIVDEPYREEDKDLLETLVNNLVVSLKNARASEALKAAYEEVSILNRAKDKMMDHLSHEIQTPVALLMSALALLKRPLASLPEKKWQRAMARAERSLARLLALQGELEDILKGSQHRNHHILCRLLDQCADELEILIAEEAGEGPVVDKVRNRIDEIFGCREDVAEKIDLGHFAQETIAKIRPLFVHRHLDLILDVEPTPPIYIPLDPLEKLIIGLIKNAIENTPDEGRVEVTVKTNEAGVELLVRDTGVGIVAEHRKRIFEGFFPTQETNSYSSKKPYDFNAGGKGADLLRLKIFSERHNFMLNMSSQKCRHIPLSRDICPGQISRCSFCDRAEDCHASGGTSFKAVFPAYNAKDFQINGI